MTDFKRHHTTEKEAHTPNSTFAIGGVSCSADSLVVAESSVLRMNICAEKPAHRKSATRCGAIRRHIGSPDCMRRCGLERLTSAHLRDFSADRSFATPAPKPRKSGDPLWAI
jgi:hypothetical protein